MENNDLTSEQEALMSAIIEEWIKVPFDTCSIVKYKAEAAINLTYQTIDERKPKEIIWFDNPLDAVIWMMNNMSYLEHRRHCSGNRDIVYLDSSIPHHINWEDNLIYPIHRNVSSLIRHKFNDNFNQVIHQKYLHWLSESFLADFLNSHLRFHLRNLWGEKIYLTKRGDFADIETSEVIGVHDIYYLAAAAFYHAIGFDRSEFKGYWSAAKHCGLWWAFYDVAVVTPKPSIIRLDSEYRLHAEGKPALVYQGFESYAHYGKFIAP